MLYNFITHGWIRKEIIFNLVKKNLKFKKIMGGGGILLNKKIKFFLFITLSTLGTPYNFCLKYFFLYFRRYLPWKKNTVFC